MTQGALGAAGVRRVWAGAGLQRAAYSGGGILRGFPHSLLYTVCKEIRRLNNGNRLVFFGPAIGSFHVRFDKVFDRKSLSQTAVQFNDVNNVLNMQGQGQGLHLQLLTASCS